MENETGVEKESGMEKTGVEKTGVEKSERAVGI